MANRLRHIALSVRDVAAAEKFFVDAFGMEKMGGSGRAVYVSDGTINIALLAVEGKPLGWEKDELFYGIDHFGVWVDDVAETAKRIEAAGGRRPGSSHPRPPRRSCPTQGWPPGDLPRGTD